MILSAHQPLYLPWAGFFHKIALADQFCVFDAVQFEYHEFGNRNRIMTHQGPLLLTVPVEKKGHLTRRFCDMKIDGSIWAEKHAKALRLSYAKAPFFKDYMEPLEAILRKHHVFLADLNVEILVWLLACLGLDRPIARASDCNFTGVGSALVLDMCLQLRANRYIFGSLGRDYADLKSFNDAGVEAVFQTYTPPVYKQVHRKPFEPRLSVLDLLFNEGANSLAVLMSGNAKTFDELKEN